MFKVHMSVLVFFHHNCMYLQHVILMLYTKGILRWRGRIYSSRTFLIAEISVVGLQDLSCGNKYHIFFCVHQSLAFFICMVSSTVTAHLLSHPSPHNCPVIGLIEIFPFSEFLLHVRAQMNYLTIV